VAKALIGTAPGDTDTVSTPRGKRELRVESLG
jgi:transcription elongation GreA/GreB family factor